MHVSKSIVDQLWKALGKSWKALGKSWKALAQALPYKSIVRCSPKHKTPKIRKKRLQSRNSSLPYRSQYTEPTATASNDVIIRLISCCPGVNSLAVGERLNKYALFDLDLA